eukprot:4000037-Heterocapsa_arctica.AAC.1
MACRPCKVPAGTRVRIRDTDFEEAGPRRKSQHMIPLPHFSIERGPPVSRNGGVAPEQGWTAEKERRLGAPGKPTVRRLVSSYRGHSFVQH